MPEKESDLTASPIANAGTFNQAIKATFDPSFFALVSEHLYSSPNKAFEELVTNSWDADAGNVYIQVPLNLQSPQAAISILDDGSSMDIKGFEQLWSIANSPKKNQTSNGRKKIGKFGIGKLATYLLCNELTYVCKSTDGVIRAVTMDYRNIDKDFDKDGNSLQLAVRVITEAELEIVLRRYEGGTISFNLIKQGVPGIKSSHNHYNEYGGQDPASKNPKNTWTLAILTSLKEQGRNIETGRTQWMLSTALPLGASMKIKFNDKEVVASKSDVPVKEQWEVGPDIPFSTFDLDSGETIAFEKEDNPYPRIRIPNVGEVTGTVTLFAASIAGGKSNAMENSNGCFVNVLGRVINTNGAGQFAVGSSGQGTYVKFRAAIRVDSLDEFMTIQRDTLTESKALKIVVAFVRRLFNHARQLEESESNALLIAASKVRKGSLNAIPLNNLAAQLQTSMDDIAALPSFITTSGDIDSHKITAWLEKTQEGRKDAIEGFDLAEEEPNELLASYDLTRRKIIVNKNHPFAIEHSATVEQRAVLEDMIVVNLLIDSYLLNNGVDPQLIKDMVTYRDISQRTTAQLRRNSPVQIIQLLEEWNDEVKPLEEVVGDALIHLGFSVKRLAQTGQPEGVAEAYITPQEEGHSKGYRFTYDAKSTKNKSVPTGNVHMAGLARHREQHNANYSLVVAPKFQKGALELEAASNSVTPMTTTTLGRLVALTISYGPLSLIQLEEMFQLNDPESVDEWVEKIDGILKSHRQFTIPALVQAIQAVRSDGGLDVLNASVVAQYYRKIINDSTWPLTGDVTRMIQGISMLASRIIAVDPKNRDRIFLTALPGQLFSEIKRQAAMLPNTLRMGILQGIDQLEAAP